MSDSGHAQDRYSSPTIPENYLELGVKGCARQRGHWRHTRLDLTKLLH